MSWNRPGVGRGLIVETSAVAVGAVILGLAAIVPVLSRHGNTPDASSQTAPAPGINLDLGPVTDPAAIEACITPGFASDPNDVDMLYGINQRTRSAGSVPVLILRNTGGDYLLCDTYGTDSPSQLPVGKATTTNPVAFFTAGRRVWSCSANGMRLKKFTMSQWLAVDDSVDQVRFRFFVDGVAQPWFTTRAHQGFVHLQVWLDGPMRSDKLLALTEQVLDSSGDVVKQHTVSTRRQQLSSCKDGSVQIG